MTLRFGSAMIALGLWGQISAHADPMNSPFTTLKTAFEAAGAAQVADFPMLEAMSGAKPPFRCEQADQDPAAGPASGLESASVGRVDFVTPSSGPLFPGGTVTKLSPLMTTQGVDGYSNAQWAQSLTDHISTYTTGRTGEGELETVLVYQGVTHTIDYRKRDSLLFVHEVLTAPGADGALARREAFAYCFPIQPPRR